MLKKLLTIAMIGTALTVSAKVEMEFRDGVLNNVDAGGHFFTTYDEATGVTTFKSFHAGTPIADIAAAIGVSEADLASNIKANPTAGPRYVRTKKPVGGNWKDKGLTEDYNWLAFSYKTNKPNSNIQVYWQEGLGNHATGVTCPMTVSDDWQTAILALDPYCKDAAGWVDMPEANGKFNDYLWIVFNDWTNATDEIVLEVKDLAWLTDEEAGIEPPKPLPGTEPGSIEAPIDITFNGIASFRPDFDEMGNPCFVINTSGGGNALLSQTFLATFEENTVAFLEFDYKSSQKIGPLVFYAMQKADHSPDPTGIAQIPNAGGPGINGTVIGIISALPEAGGEDLYDYEAGWAHVKIDLVNGKATHNGEKLAIAQCFWKQAKFAQVPESGDYIQVQDQGAGVPDKDSGVIPDQEVEFYIKNVQLVADPAGIQGVTADEASEVVSSEYFDLQGRQLKAAPEAGLFLRRDLRANGTSATVKVVK